MEGIAKINVDWPENWIKNLRNKLTELKSIY